MPEYLSPGVYVEEVPSTQTIEGVSTTVTGFIGPTCFGPTSGDPELLTSYLDFSGIYGGFDQLDFLDTGTQDNYMAYAVNAFFANGGTMLYVTRIYNPDSSSANGGMASYTPPSSLPGPPLLIARFPGECGNMQITFSVNTSPNLMVASAAPNQTVPARVSGLNANDLVFIKSPNGGEVAPGLYDVLSTNSVLSFQPISGLGAAVPLSSLNAQRMRVYRITLSVLVLRAGRFEVAQSWSDLSPNPLSRNAVTSTFTTNPRSRQLQLTVPFAIMPPTLQFSGADLVTWLFGSSFIDTTLSLSLDTNQELAVGSIPLTRPTAAQLQVTYTLQGGDDGDLPTAFVYQGQQASRDPITNLTMPATGLETFCDIDEISIVAAPGFSFGYNQSQGQADQIALIAQSLIDHCQVIMKYRVAILDSPNDMIVSEVQSFRGTFDSSYAALYYPWLKIMDVTDPDGRREIFVPPSGYVAGICAGSDIANGVSNAPANVVPLGVIDLEQLINTAQQDVLNPIGVNCFRSFTDRGIRLWGARTISSDPDWKYLNVRRYFAYVEHSLDKGTQWAVFEKNDEVTWANITQTVYDFLYNEWRNNALMGTKPEQAFFVRCDRSTMTQNDLDNGRLVCLIGIAVIKPAEFVIFRVSQFTASAAS
jgi:uncharacterized protein